MQYILTGKLVCGECGSAFVGNARKSGEYKHQYYLYSCNGRKTKRICKNKEIRKELLEKTVLDYIQKIFFSDNIDEWIDKLEALYAEQSEDSKDKEESLRKQLNQLNQGVSNYYRLIENGLNDDETIERLRILKDKRRKIESDLDYIEIKKKTPYSREQMKAYLENTKKILFDRNDLTQCQEVVERFVNKITINYDGILIDFIFGLEDVDKMVVPTRSIFISTSVSRKEIYNYSGRIAGDIDE